jgi:hypothetical protein
MQQRRKGPARDKKVKDLLLRNLAGSFVPFPLLSSLRALLLLR